MSIRAQRRLALGLVLALVAGLAWYVFGPSTADRKHVSVHFETADSLFAGAPVKVLGVQIGTVTSIHARGSYVDVEISYSASHPLPSKVEAVLVQPSVVGDRFVQMIPAYTGGPKLIDHALLGVDRTEVPITLDQTYAALDKLAAALGPNGANSHGAVSDLLNVGAANLAGNGARTRSTLTELSAALKTLASNRGNITATVDSLVTLTKALAADDPEVRQLATNLATVSRQLDAQRANLTGAVDALGPALAQVAKFVQDNKAGLTTGVTQLNSVSSALAKEKNDLADILQVLPLAITNLDHSYDAQNWDPADYANVPIDNRAGALQTRANFFNDLNVQLGSTLDGVCQTLNAAAQGALAPLCTLLSGVGASLGSILQGLLGSVLSAGSLLPSATPNSLAGLLQGGSK
jgi:phospholipid/cholesterol/gamma-HCH transport system substrate-binding protein